MDGDYGLNDIYIGTPAVLGREGVTNVIDIPLNDHESQAMHASAKQLKKVLDDGFAATGIETRQ